MRILLVSQMYPGPEDPDLGVFVAQLEGALRARGNEIERAVLDRRAGGRLRHVELAREVRRRARDFRPDVVYAHFLVPTGLGAALATRAPLVVTAHGQDVANIGVVPGVRAATKLVVERAARVIAVSHYLRHELEARVPQSRGKIDVVDCGVDLARFTEQPAPPGPAAFVCIGSLTERKNVVRLADAFTRLPEGTLTFVGDGPLRAQLEGRERVTVRGRVPHDAIPGEIARAHVVCGPSLVEPFGQALVEALASGRTVVATRIGGPPEYVTPEAGSLVDPYDVDDIAAGLTRAAAFPTPNPAARAAAAAHDVTLQAERVEEILRRAAGRGRPA